MPHSDQQPCAHCGTPTAWKGGTGHYVCAQCRTQHTPAIDDNIEYLPVPDPDTWDQLDLPAQQSRINWTHFWTEDHDNAEWIVDPIIPAARGTAIYAPAGEGKSELLLWLAVAAATGQPVLDQTPSSGHPILYLDHEQTTGDLYDRLVDMGHGPQTNLQNLHYYLLPELPPLNTQAGSDAVAQLAEHHKARAVIIDTFSRVIDGNENDSETILDYYRLTGKRLKAADIAVIRLDHAGKDKDKGQRGTSAKNDDVDLIWQVKRQEGGTMLVARKRRMGWVPETVSLNRHENPLRYEHTAVVWPEGCHDLVTTLNTYNIPVEWGRQRIRKWFADNHPDVTLGKSMVVDKAQKYRRLYDSSSHSAGEREVTNPPDSFQNMGGPVRGPVDTDPAGSSAGSSNLKTPKNVENKGGVQYGVQRGPVPHRVRGPVDPPIGGPTDPPPTQVQTDNRHRQATIDEIAP